MPRKSNQQVNLPTYDKLMVPVFKALKELGGSGTVHEINAKAIAIAGITEVQAAIEHQGEGADTEIEYRLHWTRSYLKKYGVLENSKRGVWALTPNGIATENLDPEEVKRVVKKEFYSQWKENSKNRSAKADNQTEELESDETENADWQSRLQGVLFGMAPSAFERLVQRLLRESGFTQVDVTGRSGDGGIDGKGIMRIGGLLSFPVMFQCKRWKNSVGSKEIRDFRGAMVGRADKGLFVTTGNFTLEALREATREGAPPIDLVDGDQLAEKLKELGLGVKTRKVETEVVEIDRDWFKGI